MRKFKSNLWFSMICLLPVTAIAQAQHAEEKEKDKLAEDPTKVVTQLGASYGDDSLRLSGSLSLGPVNKINVAVDADGSEWRVGGSYLFDMGIVNINVGKKEFDDNSEQTNYSIGTFLPLSYFGIEPWGIQIFGMAGYSYNDGEIACDTAVNDCGTELNPDDMVGSITYVPSTSSAGYLGAFALKPITEKWRLLGFAAGSAGTDDYHGHFVGGGLGYSLTQQQSVSLYGFTQDNSYGSDAQVGLSYRYQFQ